MDKISQVGIQGYVISSFTSISRLLKLMSCLTKMFLIIHINHYIFDSSRLHHIVLGSYASFEMSEKVSENQELKKCARKKVEILKKKI